MASIGDHMTLRRIEVDSILLIALAATDLAFIAAHVVLGLTVEHIPLMFNIATDGSLAEMVGYLKWLAISGVLFAAWRRSHIPFLLALSALFLVILSDDALQLHERLGGLVAAVFHLPSVGDLRGQDIGELAAFALIGGCLAPALALGTWRTDRENLMALAWLILLIVLLVGFGVVVDFFHAFASGIPYGPQALDLVEDGGEMLVATVILAHVVALLQHSPPRRTA